MNTMTIHHVTGMSIGQARIVHRTGHYHATMTLLQSQGPALEITLFFDSVTEALKTLGGRVDPTFPTEGQRRAVVATE